MRSPCVIAILLAVATVALADEKDSPFFPPKVQERILKSWPAGVPVPKGLRFYQPTQWSQRITITNGLDHRVWYHENTDDHFANAPTSYNPNRKFPWRVPGGLHEIKESTWKSYIGTTADPRRVQSWIERVDGGARHPLPLRRWRFPDVVFVDLLTDSAGRPFELRERVKKDGAWKSAKVWEDAAARPKGYRGHLTTGKTCTECHAKAGTSEGYGIRLRGDDSTWSWPYSELVGD